VLLSSACTPATCLFINRCCRVAAAVIVTSRRQPGVYVRLSSSVVGSGSGSASDLDRSRLSAASSSGLCTTGGSSSHPTGFPVSCVVSVGNGNAVPPHFAVSGASAFSGPGIGLAARAASGTHSLGDVSMRPTTSAQGVHAQPAGASAGGDDSGRQSASPSPSALSRSLPAPINHFMTRHPSTGRAAGMCARQCRSAPMGGSSSLCHLLCRRVAVMLLLLLLLSLAQRWTSTSI
jgi:hypothetical protein